MTDTPSTAPLSDERLAEIREWRDLVGDGEWHDLASSGKSGQVGLYSALADAIGEIDRLRAEHDELLVELDGRDEKARKRWIRKQEKQLGIKYADFRNGKWEMGLAMGREMAAAYVAMAKTLLGDAPNYSETKLEFDVKIAESPETYTLVVQRHAPGVLTPHEARLQAEGEVTRQAVVIASALDLLDGWDWDQSRSDGDNTAIPAAIAVLRGETEGA